MPPLPHLALDPENYLDWVRAVLQNAVTLGHLSDDSVKGTCPIKWKHHEGVEVDMSSLGNGQFGYVWEVTAL